MRDVTLIVGAPCSGKTTLANRLAEPGDTIVDWDQLAIEAGSPFAHDHPAEFRAAATKERSRRERTVAETQDIRAFIIRTLPSPTDRVDAARRLNATRITVVNPGMAVCLLRAREAGRPADVDSVIVKWFALEAGARNYDKPRTDRDRRNDPRRSPEWKRVCAVVRKRTTSCGICGKPIAWGKRAPHPLSFSVDHIVPLAAGGAPYDLNNLVGAHLSCNAAKGARAHEPTHRTSQAW